MRCISPSMSMWPSWADVFPNITLLPKIEAKTLIMHVGPYFPQVQATDTCICVGLYCHCPHLHKRSSCPSCTGMTLEKVILFRWPAYDSCWLRCTALDPIYNMSLIPVSQLQSMFYVQGDKDEVVPFAHGQALHKAAKNPYPPLWAAGYGHQDLEFCNQYLPVLKAYLRSLFGNEYGGRM